MGNGGPHKGLPFPLFVFKQRLSIPMARPRIHDDLIAAIAAMEVHDLLVWNIPPGNTVHSFSSIISYHAKKLGQKLGMTNYTGRVFIVRMK